MIARVAFPLVQLSALRQRVDGLTVYDASRTHGSSTEAMQRLSAALALIATYAPRRYAWLRTNIRAVGTMTELDAAAAYYAPLRTIEVKREVLLESAVEATAILIVHEMTHGRIDGHGIKLEPQRYARIERRCVLEQIDFARRLPGAEALVAWSVGMLGQQSDLLADQALVHERKATYFRESGLPRWLVRLIEQIIPERPGQ